MCITRLDAHHRRRARSGDRAHRHTAAQEGVEATLTEQALSIDKLYAGISRDPMSESDLSYCDCQVLLDRTYFLPLGDRSWSDDTLVEVEYIEDLSPGAARRCAPSNREKAE